MKSLTVDIPKGDIPALKRAIESCRDVLHGIPKYDDEAREVAIKGEFVDRIRVNNGNRTTLPAGKYIIQYIGYKYITINKDNKEYQVEANEISKVEVLA